MQNQSTYARTAAKITFKSSLLFRQATLAAILMLAAVSCQTVSDKTPDQKTKEQALRLSGWSYEVRVFEVDSCEYIVTTTGTINGGVSTIHKQNCKFCDARRLSK